MQHGGNPKQENWFWGNEQIWTDRAARGTIGKLKLLKCLPGNAIFLPVRPFPGNYSGQSLETSNSP